MNNLWLTDSKKIYSQGIVSSPDENAVLFHDSTYPPLLHKLEYGSNYARGINMDRGGFGKRKDGSLFACLFDGTGGGGLASAYAAQDFTLAMLHELEQSPLKVEDKEEVKNLLHKTSHTNDAPYGDATCVAVDILPDELRAIALGDSGIIHIEKKTKKAHLFETILKEDRTNTQDTGGCMGRGGRFYHPENICLFSTPISKGDFIVLASDGLLDNLARGEENELLTLIVTNSVFDEEASLPGQYELPDIDVLSTFYEESFPSSPLQIVKRLNNYIKSVTREKHEALKNCLEQWEEAKKRNDRDAILELMHAFKQTNHRLAGKCDDCLLICIKV